MSKKPAVTSKNYLTVPPGDYPCGNNLYLIVAPTGARRWLFVFQRDGIKDKMGFGSANDVTLKEATDKAIDARRLLAKGINPKDQRDDERRAATGCQLFGPYATAWRETYDKSLKHKSSRAKLKNQIDNHCAALHKLRMDEISTDHIIKLVLDPIRGKAETARDIRQRLSLIFKAAIADDLRKDNPADYETQLHPKMGKAPKRGKVRGKHKAMSHHALPAFMAKVAACPDLSARAIEITVLAVARTAEILNMKWSDIDLETTIWTIDTTGIRADDSDGGRHQERG
jgi:integrase